MAVKVRTKETEKKGDPLLPLRDIVVFPGMVTPLFVGREKSIKAVDYAIEKNDSMIMLSAQKTAGEENPNEDGIYNIGCLCQIMQIFKMPDETVKIMVEGISRATILDYVSTSPLFIVKSKEFAHKPYKVVPAKIEAVMRNVKSLFDKYIILEHRFQPGHIISVADIGNPDSLVDTVMSHINAKTALRQLILSEASAEKRISMLIKFLKEEIEILQIEKKVKGRVKKQMDKSQKEYYLNEQMKAIQKELGKADAKSDHSEYRSRILKCEMPETVESKALKELAKLELMPPMSAEGTVVRNYLDWLLDLPWTKRTSDNLNTQEALTVLNEDHYGLEDIKERVLEFLAVKQLSKTGKSPILCLVGPPGVGKTSLGKSVARALGRKFVRVSLGGIRDEAEIRGHRKTYIGSLPGRIIQSMKKAGTINPVLMLDEIDKMSSDFRGDPSSAMLEVLDPEQNKTFSDHYLEVDYDLSNILFITTANMLNPIPIPLLDRMEVLEISGYTEKEKLEIGKMFLVPKQLKENGLSTKELKFTDKAILKLINSYTREAGVRNLEREISSICRKTARKLVEKKKYPVKPNPADIVKYLGPEKYRHETTEEHEEPGFAIGMAWTRVGGDIMNVEVSVVEGKGKLILTGKLGDVMKESAQAALTYIRSRATQFNLKKDFYAKSDIHIHFPEGAIPKDGPSAGITMVTAMVSAFCKVPVRHDVSMTGEVTLRGKVLPIGGLKEKVLAAHRAGIKEIIFPIENKKDLEKIPGNVIEEIKFTPVASMDEVLMVAMSGSVFVEPKKKVRKSGGQVSGNLSNPAGVN